MLRNTMITLVASAALALGASAAFAEPHGHGGGGVHFGGGHFGGGHFGGPSVSFGFAAPYAYDYDSDYGCYAMRRVWTPYGWRVHRVYVCN